MHFNCISCILSESEFTFQVYFKHFNCVRHFNCISCILSESEFAFQVYFKYFNTNQMAKIVISRPKTCLPTYPTYLRTYLPYVPTYVPTYPTYLPTYLPTLRIYPTYLPTAQTYIFQQILTFQVFQVFQVYFKYFKYVILTFQQTFQHFNKYITNI